MGTDDYQQYFLWKMKITFESDPVFDNIDNIANRNVPMKKMLSKFRLFLLNLNLSSKITKFKIPNFNIYLCPCPGQNAGCFNKSFDTGQAFCCASP